MDSNIPCYIRKILATMYTFQKKYEIKNECMTNAQYLYDSLRLSGFHVRACPLLATSYTKIAGSDDYEFNVVAGHVGLLLDNRIIIDGSYDIMSSPNVQYYTTIANLFETHPHLKNDKKFAMYVVEGLCIFQKIANRINNGELIVNDKDFYHKQADYVESVLKNGYKGL